MIDWFAFVHVLSDRVRLHNLLDKHFIEIVNDFVIFGMIGKHIGYIARDNSPIIKGQSTVLNEFFKMAFEDGSSHVHPHKRYVTRISIATWCMI